MYKLTITVGLFKIVFFVFNIILRNLHNEIIFTKLYKHCTNINFELIDSLYIYILKKSFRHLTRREDFYYQQVDGITITNPTTIGEKFADYFGTAAAVILRRLGAARNDLLRHIN
jgi:hypothetical protein